MSNSPKATTKPPQQLLTGQQVRKLFGVAHPGYGAEFSDEQWEAIAERLSALTRLIWRIRSRQTTATAPGTSTQK